MPFVLLFVLAVACLVQIWAPPPGDGPLWVSALLSWGPVLGVLAGTYFVTRWVQRRLLLRDAARDHVLRRYYLWRPVQLVGLILAYGLTVYAFGWGWVVAQLCTICDEPRAALAPGAEVLVLAPFLIGLLVSWACYYDVERAIHDTSLPTFLQRPYWSRSSYVSFHARQNLALVATPLVLVLLLQGVRHTFPGIENNDWFHVAAFAVLLVAICCQPWVLRAILGLRSLPEGPLRDRLLAAARRLRFRCSDILLWDTHCGLANAVVAGVIPKPRYVIFSDRLLAHLEDEEIEAVFGHEVGHIKHHHIVYYLGFMLISMGVLLLIWSVVASHLVEPMEALLAFLPGDCDEQVREQLTLLPFLPVVGLYVFVVFGFLSRRCERQADIYGCRAVSCDRRDCAGHSADVQLQPQGRGLCPTGIRTFIQALEKVAALSGLSRSRPGWMRSWQHSTIARRVEFLQNMLTDPALEPHFQKRVSRVKWALLLGLAVMFVILFVTQG
jgi:Zn-dependent protease with chaperone function